MVSVVGIRTEERTKKAKQAHKTPHNNGSFGSHMKIMRKTCPTKTSELFT